MSPPYFKPPYSHTRPIIPTKRLMFGLNCPVCSRSVWSFETTTSSLDGSTLAKPYFYVTCALKCFVTSSRHYSAETALLEWQQWGLAAGTERNSDEQKLVDRLLKLKLSMQSGQSGPGGSNKKGGG